MHCHVCGGDALFPLAESESFFQVTSDVRPSGKHAGVAICTNCGTVQKQVDEHWLDSIACIYEQYEIYVQAAGREQAIFADDGSQPMPRSWRLLKALPEHMAMPKAGRLLDFGCANGTLLQSFSQLFPGWQMEGAELKDKYRDTVMAIEGVAAFHSENDPGPKGPFDLITLSHVLEHLVDPASELKRLSGLLAPGGFFLIAVPDLEQTPFDLVIADHCTHFTRDTLSGVVARAGLRLCHLSDKWLPKELVAIIAPATATDTVTPPAVDIAAQQTLAQRQVASLLRYRDTALSLGAREKDGFGFFGSSIAACWLAQELGGLGRFFVDEDPQRAGNSFMDHPILLPADCPPGSVIFVALPPAFARRVAERLTAAGLRPVLPDAKG